MNDSKTPWYLRGSFIERFAVAFVVLLALTLLIDWAVR